MANEKRRLIDANDAERVKKALAMCYKQGLTSECEGCVYKANKNICMDALMEDALALINSLESCIDAQPTVDAVELPKGKPGDYLEWDNGTGFRKIYYIYAVMICEDCMRYDLEEFTPAVNHKNIVRIMSREEAKAALAKMDGGNEDEQP